MLTLEAALPEARDPETKGQLFKQLQGLADTILDGYTSQLASLAQNPDMAQYMSQIEEKYLQERHSLINPLGKYQCSLLLSINPFPITTNRQQKTSKIYWQKCEESQYITVL